MSSATQITVGVVGFFVILALLVFLRLLMRKQQPSWKRLRLGVFVERNGVDDAAEDSRRDQ